MTTVASPDDGDRAQRGGIMVSEPPRATFIINDYVWAKLYIIKYRTILASLSIIYKSEPRNHWVPHVVLRRGREEEWPVMERKTNGGMV
ncbi:hypothetical protein BC936DRAFT_140904 [Jimgerdemannia flammicorona]|uniref:Uncharacterized protein n=1 Tax=Jimgerdemannia flammicorona TaxID=994334 RepID=A0A433DGH9_9FUNG|nr:hypothetical protein BC936DRAFT_140904 [Jimgerdemannia flammicorona]